MCRKEHKKRRVAKRSKTGRVWRKYSRRWWYWSSEGRQEWRRCKRHGASSAYWTKHHCNRHGGEVQEYSRFWWWTGKGRALWRQCKKEGQATWRVVRILDQAPLPSTGGGEVQGRSRFWEVPLAGASSANRHALRKLSPTSL